MCGIAGAVGFVDQTIQRAVRTASDRQTHRGPDSEGFWSANLPVDKAVAFAHRRLAIIDLRERANQPMVDPDSGAVLVYNGEVYNFRELRAELVAAGLQFESDSDTEVVLKAFAHWGKDFVRRLRGMFAFAIFDPASRTVFIARDPLGIKPVYIGVVDRGQGKRTLFFASELRSILATGLVDRHLDPLVLQTYLWHGFVAGRSSIIDGVFCLEAGCTLTVDLDGLRMSESRYWRLPAATPTSDAIEGLRAELREAVRLRLISDVPLGVFLSGGIDSSAIAALAMSQSTDPIKTFTITFDEARFDESGYARSVASALGTEHSEVHLDQHTFRDHLSEALDCIDQPTFDALNTYFVSRAVKQAGLTVALAGTGGDELFGGYASFRDLPRVCRWSRLAGYLPGPLVRGGAQLVTRWKLGKAGLIPPQTRWGKLRDLLSQPPTLLNMYQLSYALFLPDLCEQLHAGSASAEIQNGLASEDRRMLNDCVKGQPTLHAVSSLELWSFVGQRLLPDTDAASMASSLEVRVPLLDHRLVEAVSRVSAAERFEPVGSKRLLRRLALDHLDQTLFDRPKAGFELPLAVWSMRELRDELDATFSDEGLCAAAGLNAQVVRRVWRAYLDKAPGLYWSRVWSLFVLLRWCRAHSVRI